MTEHNIIKFTADGSTADMRPNSFWRGFGYISAGVRLTSEEDCKAGIGARYLLSAAIIAQSEGAVISVKADGKLSSFSDKQVLKSFEKIA
jgi:hypothetical protein